MGTRVDISLTVSPIINEHSQIVGASKIARNITERKRIEEPQVRTQRKTSSQTLLTLKQVSSL
jgi:hypothetical protein